MKILLLPLFILPLYSSAQTLNVPLDKPIPDSALRRALYRSGQEMRLFSELKTTGIILSLAGGACITIGATQNSSGKANTGIYVAGGVLIVAGGLMSLSANSHVGKAGMILRTLSGVVPIRYHKVK